jgi:plastocyanin
MKPFLVALGIVVMLILVCGCTQSPPAQPPVTTTAAPAVTTLHQTPVVETTPSVSDNTINIRKKTFIPANITIRAGETVRWVNGDDFPHRIQFADSRYATVLMGASQSASQRFDRPGVFEYTCLIHPEMHGTVSVV